MAPPETGMVLPDGVRRRPESSMAGAPDSLAGGAERRKRRNQLGQRDRPCDPSGVTHRYARMCAKLGIDSHLHALRHYSATELLTAGVDLRTSPVD